MTKEKKPFKDTKVGNFFLNTTIGRGVIETARTLPVAGPFVSALVESRPNAEPGVLKTNGWDKFRITIGLILIAAVLELIKPGLFKTAFDLASPITPVE